MAKERRKAVLELLQRPGNARCADCGAPDPDWASYTLGVFICLSCSGIHRNIPHVSKVKSVRLDTWEDVQVEFMASRGNAIARATFESRVPPFYYRPSASDCPLLREQWIRAKYERQEFAHPERQEPYSAGYREGFLWKRGRDNGQFLSRKFVLTEREGALKYFNRSDAKEPKAVMKIEHLNATFQPAKIGHPHGLQVTYLKDNSTRNIFVYHEDGKEMVDWFNALRAARFHYLQVAFPGASNADLVPKLSRNYLQEGYMEKTGPKVGLTQRPGRLGLTARPHPCHPGLGGTQWGLSAGNPTVCFVSVGSTDRAPGALGPVWSAASPALRPCAPGVPAAGRGGQAWGPDSRTRWRTGGGAASGRPVPSPPSRQKASASAGLPWTTAGSCTSRTRWTPSPAGKSSSAAERAATRCWTGSHHPPRATTGHTGSPLSRQSAGFCWPARRSRSSGRGWRRSGRWWTGPCCPRSTQWKPTSSTSPSTRRSRRPEDSGLPRCGCRRPRLTGPELQPRAPVSGTLRGLAHPPWDTHSPPTDLCPPDPRSSKDQPQAATAHLSGNPPTARQLGRGDRAGLHAPSQHIFIETHRVCPGGLGARAAAVDPTHPQ
uniref:ArfGAP with dual PH domains 1 n=1 Tax=Bos indicus x Bos taurus TaxID=30522 RepID=A0A4W2GAU8_BOBOX